MNEKRSWRFFPNYFDDEFLVTLFMYCCVFLIANMLHLKHVFKKLRAFNAHRNVYNQYAGFTINHISNNVMNQHHGHKSNMNFMTFHSCIEYISHVTPIKFN